MLSIPKQDRVPVAFVEVPSAVTHPLEPLTPDPALGLPASDACDHASVEVAGT
jgi:hypothetical protein